MLQLVVVTLAVEQLHLCTHECLQLRLENTYHIIVQEDGDILINCILRPFWPKVIVLLKVQDCINLIWSATLQASLESLICMFA